MEKQHVGLMRAACTQLEQTPRAWISRGVQEVKESENCQESEGLNATDEAKLDRIV